MNGALTARLLHWRRWARRHRRAIAAALTFVATMLILGALLPGDAGAEHGGAGLPGADGSTPLPPGQVAAPVRVADSEVAALLHSGDTVDVVAADGRGDADVVADAVTVLAVPQPTDALLGAGTSEGSLVLLAVPSSTGVALAAAAAVGPLSLLLRP